MSALLDAALAYAARGWPVFPCTPGAKTPAGQLVHRGVLDASTDPAQISAWWTAEPGANVGIATGSPGPDVVDIDVKEGGSGWQALAAITQAGLADGSSAYVRTPSGGLHAYYAGTSQRNGSIRKQRLDFRAAGGYVLAPPSIVGGRPYELAGTPGGAAPVDWAAIRAYLDPPPDPVPFAQPNRSSNSDLDSRNSSSELRPGDDWAARTSWAEILQPRGWRRTRDLGNGRAMWRRPGKKDGSSATTREDGGLYVFSSSTEFEVEVPYTKFGAWTLLNFGGTDKHHFQEATAQLRRLEYGTPLPQPAITFAQPQQPASDQQDAAETDADAPAEWWTEIAARHQMVDWQQLFDDTPEHEEWLIEPLIAVGRSIAFYSPAKAGKSLLALEISCALVAGRPVLGQPAGPPRRVLYVDLENSRRDLKSRVTDLGYKPADLDGLAYLSFPSMPTLDSAEGGREIVALAIAHRIDLVIIDTVSRVISGKENDADTFNALYRHAIGPLKNLDIAVMRLDHAGKDLARGQRGSSSKNADVDSVWTLNVAGPVITLRCEMSRFQQDWPAISLRRHADPLRHEVTSSPVIGKAQALMATLDDLGVPRSATNRECLDALNQAAVGVNTNDLREAVRTRKLQMPLSQDHQTENADSADLRQNEAESGISAGQRLSQDHKTEKDSASHGAKVVSVSSGGPSIEGPAKTDADAQVRNRPDCCHRCGEIGSHSPGCEAAA